MTHLRFGSAIFGAVILSLAAINPSLAQGMQVNFGGIKQDTSLPVEMTADQLSVDQATNTAVFTGNVLIGQGDMRLSAGSVRVEYQTVGGQPTGRISRLFAKENVVLVTGAEAAEAQSAVYSIDSGTIIMTGNVLLTQGFNALSSQKMTVNLTSGNAVMEGRVKTIIQPAKN